MKTITQNKSIICYNKSKYNDSEEIENYLNSEKFKNLREKVEQNYSDQIIFVLGWDWTMLKAIRENFKEKKIFLWINFWNKWFLLNKREEVEESKFFEEIIYPLIKCKVKCENEVFKTVAFNEVDFRADTWKIIDLDLEIDETYKTNLKWDWFLYCTPFGSTWYNFSLNWPIIPHSLESFVLTPKAPWLPRCFKSVIINDKKTLKIKNTWRLSDIKIICDWTDFFEVKNKNIEVELKKSKNYVSFLIPKWSKQKWTDKILLEQGFSSL